VPPLGGTPRLPALGVRLPRKGAPAAGPRRRFIVEPFTRPHPLRGRLAAGPLAELDLVPRRRVDPIARCAWLAPAAPGSLTRPFREEQVGGGPSCRQVGQLSWDSVPRRTSSKTRAMKRSWFIRASDQTLADLGPYARFTSGETPRRRDAVRPRYPPRLASWRRPSLTLQSPSSFRPPGCPSSRIVSVTELGNPSAPGSRQPQRFLTYPLARSRAVVGPPVARGASSHGIQSLVDSARRHEQRTVLAYSRFGPDPFGPGTLHALRLG